MLPFRGVPHTVRTGPAPRCVEQKNHKRTRPSEVWMSDLGDQKRRPGSESRAPLGGGTLCSLPGLPMSYIWEVRDICTTFVTLDWKIDHEVVAWAQPLNSCVICIALFS